MITKQIQWALISVAVGLVWLWLSAIVLHFIPADAFGFIPMLITWGVGQGVFGAWTLQILNANPRDFETK